LSAASQHVEASGRTVDEATAAALHELGLRPGEAEVQVLDEGGRGFLGLSARLARVRAERLSKSAAGVYFMTSLGAHLGSPVEVVSQERLGVDGQREIVLGLQTTDSGQWIGRRGRTLDAVECLCDAVATRISQDRDRLVVDVDGYRAQREQALQALARRVAGQVLSSGRAVTLEPMPASERRIVHMTVQSIAGVRSESTGVGAQRRVVLAPEQ